MEQHLLGGYETWLGTNKVQKLFLVDLDGEALVEQADTERTYNALEFLPDGTLLAGGITAFAGPIAFVGLAVPHLTRQLIPTSDHRILLPGVIIFGAGLMLICDTIAQIPGSEYTLPINAITSLVGAPVVIWLLVRKRKLLF